LHRGGASVFDVFEREVSRLAFVWISLLPREVARLHDVEHALDREERDHEGLNLPRAIVEVIELRSAEAWVS
jgi:hypothetical protein